MTTPDRETLAAAVAQRFCEMRGRRRCADCYMDVRDADAAVDALLPLLAPPPSEGEADEAAGRVAAFLAAHEAACDHAQIAVEFEQALLAADLRLLLADRELWRERAFRAARLVMEPEEGSKVQWGVTDSGLYSDFQDEATARAWVAKLGGRVVCRTVGPWRESPGGEPN